MSLVASSSCNSSRLLRRRNPPRTIPVVRYFFPDTPLVSSYHTNLAMYATLFGFSWLTPVMWGLQVRFSPDYALLDPSER